MTPSNIPDLPLPDEESTPPAVPLFTVKAMSVATFFGGPLAASLLASLNYRRTGAKSSATRALIVGLVSTALLVDGLFRLPEEFLERVPSSLIPALYCAIITALLTKLQGPLLKSHFAQGGRKGSAWTVTGIAAGSLALTLVAFVPYALWAAPFNFGGERFAYGPQSHLIYHNGVPSDVLHSLGDYLERIEYFGPTSQMAVQLQATEAGYTLHLPTLHAVWEDEDFLASIHRVHHELEADVLKSPVTLELIDQDLRRTYHRTIPRD